MPNFEAGSSHNFTVPVTNQGSEAIAAQLSMRVGAQEHAQTQIQLEPGVPYNFTGSIGAPEGAGTYQVNVVAQVQLGDSLVEVVQPGEDVVVEDIHSFDMVVDSFSVETDKFATAYWVFTSNVTISNPWDVEVTNRVRVIAAHGEYDSELLSSYIFNRYWGPGSSVTPRADLLWKEVTLAPGASIQLESPAYYFCDELHVFHLTHEFINEPDGTYISGVRKKYWVRVLDDNGYWGPLASVGTALTY